jgi:hypothetical protein
MELPSKKRSLDWTLGPRANILRERYKADYALFIHVRNTYADGGRVAYGLALVLLFGIAIPMGEQVGFASLVDLKNGDVVWYNKLHRAGGDMRTLEPTRESANVLLASMPK